MINRPKGVNDILPSETKLWNKVEDVLKKVCYIYNYKEIRTPIFEKGELFHRDNNDSSDMVNKETYDFYDRNKELHTLRPEGTAGIVRSFIQNKLHAEGIVNKLFYLGPMFRYERPQKGRFRQFHQFGCEAMGSNSPLLDSEIISLAVSIIKALKLKGIKVIINSLGDEETRKNYKESLVDYFLNHEETLCEDCKTRLKKNPLRMLDCKVCSNTSVFENAPKINDFLTETSKKHFEEVLSSLDDMKIDYEVKSNLVRGLDYYSHTVFEIEVDIKDFGSQNVICAGGRYDNLVKDLGGVNTPSCGFAFGIERLISAIESENINLVKEDYIHAFIISIGQEANKKALTIAQELRLGGIKTEIDFQNRSFKSQFNLADKYNSRYILILGDEEIKNEVINVKDKIANTQESVKLEDLYLYLLKKINSNQALCNNCKKE